MKRRNILDNKIILKIYWLFWQGKSYLKRKTK